MNSQAQLSAAQTLASTAASASLGKATAPRGNDDEANAGLEAVEDDDTPVDETGVDPKDIDLVINQVSSLYRIYAD